MDEYNAYNEWEDEEIGFSGVSPEAFYAELAWNAAIEKACDALRSHNHEYAVNVISGLDTGFRGVE